MLKQYRQGFTLVECLIVLVIIGFLWVFNLPIFQDFLTRQEAEATLSHFSQVIEYGRKEALMKRKMVTLCPTRDGRFCSSSKEWSEGVMLFENPGRLSYVSAAGDLKLTHIKSLKYGKLYFQAPQTLLHIEANGTTSDRGKLIYCPKTRRLQATGIVINSVARTRSTIQDPRSGEVDIVVCPS